MKRLVCVLTVLFLLILTACGNKSPFSDTVPPTVPVHFSSDMRIQKDDGEMTASIVRDVNGVTEITVKTPEELNGLAMRFGSDSGSLSYGGMSLDIDYSKFPDTAVFKLLLDTLKRLSADAKITVSKTAAGWEYILSDDGNEKITVIQNADTGFIDSISVPSHNLNVTFSNFKELPEETTE